MQLHQRPLVAALCSSAIPGFGQIYNRQLGKGTLFLIMEFVINTRSHLNDAVFYSWLFQVDKAQQIIDYEWLLFYPCFYVFAIYDAYHFCCIHARIPEPRFMFLPFVVAWMLGTIAIIISSGYEHVGGVERLGPIFSGVLVLLIVLIGGCLLVSALQRRSSLK